MVIMSSAGFSFLCVEDVMRAAMCWRCAYHGDNAEARKATPRRSAPDMRRVTMRRTVAAAIRGVVLRPIPLELYVSVISALGIPSTIALHPNYAADASYLVVRQRGHC